MNFGGVEENVVTRSEFPLEKAREVLKNETIRSPGPGTVIEPERQRFQCDSRSEKRLEELGQGH